MDFNEFRNRLKQDVGKIITEAYPGSTAVPREVDKLQGQSYSALSVSAKDSRLGMSLNMDSLYAQMQGGTDYADILQQAGQQSPTVKKIHNLLRSCFHQAVKWDLREKNPALYATVPYPFM